MADMNSARAKVAAYPLYISFLVEDLLNEDVLRETPHQATRARVLAAYALSAGNDMEAATLLDAARHAIESERRINWRDALRANTELALHLVALGHFDRALPCLRRAFELLKGYFGATSLGASELQYLIGCCEYRNAEFESYAERLAQSEAIRKHFSERARATSLRALESLVEAGQEAYMARYDAAATSSTT